MKNKFNKDRKIQAAEHLPDRDKQRRMNEQMEKVHEDFKQKIAASVLSGRKPCPNCKETAAECACVRNKCAVCGGPVGNVTFTVCDDCWTTPTKK